MILWAVVLATVFFVSFGVAYRGPNSGALLAHCVYAAPDCSLAAGTWVLALVTAGALLAAVGAYFIEVRPLIAMRQISITDAAAQPEINVYVAADDDNEFEVLIDEAPANFLSDPYRVAWCRFANVGRSPLLGLAAELRVVRTNHVERPNGWDGTPQRVRENNVFVSHIPLDHLTAGDNETQRVVYVKLYLDAELEGDTTVQWTGIARTTTRRFRFEGAPPLKFGLPPENLK